MLEGGKRTVSEHPAADYFAGIVLAGGYLIAHYAGISRPQISQATSLLIYQTLAGIAAALLGLVFAAVAIIRALDPGRRLRILQQRYGSAITASMMAVIRGLGLATALTLLAMFLDQPGGLPVLARALALFAVGLGAARITRLAWIFSLILDVNDEDARRAARKDMKPPPLQLPPERRASGE